MTQEININFVQKAGKPIPLRSYQKKVKKILEKEFLTKRKIIELNIIVVGNDRIKSLNREYRGKDKVTDVITFGSFGDSIAWGDIFICYYQALRQARDYEHSLKEEIEILLIHGLAHLYGYDHNNNQERKSMNAWEKKHLKKTLTGR